jgi:acyl-CoA reductase-like NAD-dependent aldehyde dehydrogenase
LKKIPEPLALYVYTSSRKKENYWLENIAFGGGCINNSAWHLTNYYLPLAEEETVVWEDIMENILLKHLVITRQ